MLPSMQKQVENIISFLAADTVLIKTPEIINPKKIAPKDSRIKAEALNP
jgi:hypothetical protein